jgi:phage tail-like protein
MAIDLRITAKAPAIYSREGQDGVWPDLTALLQELLGREHDDTCKLQTLWNTQTCPVEWLPHLAQKLGWFLDTTKPEVMQRKVVGLLMAAYREKGTAVGIADMMRLILGFEVVVIAPWNDGWHVGISPLGQG